MFRQPNRPTREQRIAARAARNAAQALTCMERPRSVMGGSTAGPVALPKVPAKSKVRQAIRDSAKGEACTVRLPGICTNDPETTIWSHARWLDAGKGGATKAVDVAGAYACTACDAVYDGQRKPPPGYTRDDIDRDWCMGHFRSLVILARKGLI